MCKFLFYLVAARGRKAVSKLNPQGREEEGETMSEYAGHEWVERQMVTRRPDYQMSELGKDVADLLGEWLYGIYHRHPEVMRVDWENPHWIEITLFGSLSTFDFSDLTSLVFLAHDYCLRVEIEPRSNKYYRLMFHRRSRDGDIYKRHPTIEGALLEWRKYHPNRGRVEN